MNDICITMHCWYLTPSSSPSVSVTSYNPTSHLILFRCIHRFVTLIVEWLVVWSSSRAWPASKWDLTILLFHGVPQDCLLGCFNRIVLWLLLNGSLFDSPQGWLISEWDLATHLLWPPIRWTEGTGHQTWITTKWSRRVCTFGTSWFVSVEHQTQMLPLSMFKRYMT